MSLYDQNMPKSFPYVFVIRPTDMDRVIKLLTLRSSYSRLGIGYPYGPSFAITSDPLFPGYVKLWVENGGKNLVEKSTKNKAVVVNQDLLEDPIAPSI